MLVAPRKSSDLIVVVGSAPGHFLSKRYCAIEKWLRKKIPDVPVVFLSPECHLGNNWFSWLKKGNNERAIPPKQWGMERFDWYLCCRQMLLDIAFGEMLFYLRETLPWYPLEFCFLIPVSVN